jgi:hypothetical protein
MLVKSRLVITLIVLLITLIAATVKAQAGQANTQVILDLQKGRQYFGVPRIYQGDYNGRPTNQWPVYYGPNNASQYWSQGNITSNQPVLELVPGPGSGGAMFWSETYSGGTITITIQATASSIVWLGVPFQVYLFLKPTMWGISPQYNYSIPYKSYISIGGDVILPQSSTPYIVVQWSPSWQYAGYTQSGTTGGQWNVWIVSNPSGNNASVGPYPSPNLGNSWVGWLGIGTGYFKFNPGHRINITVTYDSSTNTLSGVATDLSACVLVLLNKTVRTICPKASFTLNLSGYFTPPSSGNYVFGVGAATLDYGGNGALLYVAMIGNVTSQLPSPTYYSVIFSEVGLPPGAVWNVTLNGVTKASNNSSIIFTVPTGEYNYSVASPILVNGVEYVATEPTGTVTVNNTNVTVIVQYVPATPPPPSRSSLAVQVFNVNNKPATSVPGVVYGVLYNSSGFKTLVYMNSSGYLNFNNLTPGTYTLEVYHYPNLGLNFTEYWGGMTMSLKPGNNFVTFYRHEPWIYDLQAVGNGARITINVTVNNPLNAILHGKLYIWVTTSPQTANPSEPTIDTSATSITIRPGLNKFTYYNATTQNGPYYIYTALLIYNKTQLITTDQWNWTALYQLKFVITSWAPTVSFKLYKSNNYFRQVQEIASVEISDGSQTIIFSLSQGIYKYDLSLSNQDYTIAPSPTGFINLTKNQNIRLFVIQTRNSPLVNLIPVGLPDPLQWYVTYQSPLASLIFLPDRNGAIRLNVFSFFYTGTYIVNLNVYSTNPQYYPLLPTIQLNATYLFLHSPFSNKIYAVPFAMAGHPAHIVKRNGVQWNPLLNEYYQHNPRYAYSRYVTIPYTNINMKVYERQDGFCWGMSSTAILYYLGYLPLPSQGARYTSQLYLGPINASGYLEYLTDASLAVAVHQIFDPDNNALIHEISKAISRNSAIASKAISYIDNNESVILIIRFTNQSGNSLYVGSGYHAVVAWGYVKEPNGNIVFLVYDPNYPQIITRATYYTNGSFIYIDGGPPYSINVNGQIFSYPGDIGEVIGVASPQPAKLQWFNPNQWLLDLALCSLNPSRCWLWWLNQQRVQILQSGLLDYTLYVSTKPLNVFLGGELAGYFVDKYFVTASKVSPGSLAGYVDGNPSSRLYIVAVRNDVAARVDPDSTLVAIRFANASGNVMVYGFVANSTEPIAVQFVNHTSFIMASPSSTVVKLELFSAINSSVKTYNTTLELNSGTEYVVSANFTNLTNVTIKTVTMSWERTTPTQTATTATTVAQTAVQPSAQTATATSASVSGIQPPPPVIVLTPQLTANANGQTQQIGLLQIAIWALVGITAFLLAYLLSRSVLSRKP